MVQYSVPVESVFAALADATRRDVVDRLSGGSASVSALAEPYGISLTGMKKHLRVLEDARLIQTEKIGRVRMCSLVPYAFEGITTWVSRLDRFAEVVQRTLPET